MSFDNVSEAADTLREHADSLEEATSEDVDDAVSTLDSVAYQLREAADGIESLSNRLQDARNILS